jgi:hypothetical protein
VVFNSRKHASPSERATRQRLLERAESSALWLHPKDWDAPPELITRIVAARAGPSPVMRPKTFIAGRLWQRYGKLRPDEMPRASG